MGAEANMLYLESPVGVGFSYSTNKSFYDTLDDEKTGSSLANILKLEKKIDFFYLLGNSYRTNSIVHWSVKQETIWCFFRIGLPNSQNTRTGICSSQGRVMQVFILLIP